MALAPVGFRGELCTLHCDQLICPLEVGSFVFLHQTDFPSAFLQKFSILLLMLLSCFSQSPDVVHSNFHSISVSSEAFLRLSLFG